MKKIVSVIFTLIFIACPIMAIQCQAAIGDTVYLRYDKNIDEDVIGMPENPSAVVGDEGYVILPIAQDATPTIEEYEHPDGQTYKYEFEGWYYDADGYLKNKSSSIYISTTKTLYAKWSVTKTQTSPVITIKFNVNCNNTNYNTVSPPPQDRYIRVDAETYELDLSGIDIGDEGAPTRVFAYEQYIFDGWCYDITTVEPAHTGDIINPDTQCRVPGVITLYARWKCIADIRIWHDETIEDEESFTVSAKGFKGFKDESVELGITCSGINENANYKIKWECEDSSISLTPSEDCKTCIVKYSGASKKNAEISVYLQSPSGDLSKDSFIINYQKTGSIFTIIVDFFINLFT